jgi:hypothetical protein
MSPTSNVTRLRGDGLEVVWPAKAMESAIDWVHSLREITPARPPAAPPEWWPAGDADEALFREIAEDFDARHAAWWETMLAAQRASAELFAEAQGWTHSTRALAPQYLLRPKNRRPWHQEPGRAWYFDDRAFDHPTWFSVGRTLAGVVVHNYPALDLSLLPAEIVVDRLPGSWYYPGRTTAYLLRPSAKATAGAVGETSPRST